MKVAKLEKADPQLLAAACMHVLADMYRNGEEPGAEKWQNCTRRCRPELVARIHDRWRMLAGCDTGDIVPWHDDFIIEVFVFCRKMQGPAKTAGWMEFGVAPPSMRIERDVPEPTLF
jgi:hypothetical protein